MRLIGITEKRHYIKNGVSLLQKTHRFLSTINLPDAILRLTGDMQKAMSNGTRRQRW